jgi:hypothetical protein
MQNQISTEIGTELLFENDRIRVWQMVLQPGEESPHHRHEADYVFVYTTPSRITAFLEGQEPSTSDFDDGFVQYWQCRTSSDTGRDQRTERRPSTTAARKQRA